MSIDTLQHLWNTTPVLVFRAWSMLQCILAIAVFIVLRSSGIWDQFWDELWGAE